MCNEQVEISSALSAGSLPACRRADRAKCCRLIYECFVPKLNCSRFIAHPPPTRVLIMLLATPCCDGTFAPPRHGQLPLCRHAHLPFGRIGGDFCDISTAHARKRKFVSFRRNSNISVRFFIFGPISLRSAVLLPVRFKVYYRIIA